MQEMLARGPLEILPDLSAAQARRTSATPVTFKLYDRDGGGSRCAVDTTLVADVIAENDDIVVYESVDATAPVSVENANTMIDFYSAHGKEIIDRYFGGVSDVNGDGKIALLVDPTLSGIQAYVWSGDMTFPATACAASNETELVHMSAGAFAQFDDEGYWALSGLVHEAKHVSSLYKRVVNHRLRGSRMADETFHPLWIEEGTAEIAKEMSSRLAWERAGRTVEGGAGRRRHDAGGAPQHRPRVLRRLQPHEPGGARLLPGSQRHRLRAQRPGPRVRQRLALSPLRARLAGRRRRGSGQRRRRGPGDRAQRFAHPARDRGDRGRDGEVHCRAAPRPRHRDDGGRVRRAVDGRRHAALPLLRLPHRDGDLREPRSAGTLPRGPRR